MQRKINFWDVLFYGGLSVLSMWAILKSVGIIQTPLWLEIGVPILSGVIAVSGLYQQIFEMITTIKTDLNNMKIDIALMNSKVDHLDKDMESVKKDMTIMKRKISVV